MKCDELKAETIVPQGCTLTLQMYPKGEVDAAITELKARIHELESMPHTDNSAVIERISNENERLKAKLESVQATAYTESVDAGMENRKLKRALWLARVELCHRLDVDRYLRKHRNSWYNENCLTWAEACVAMEVKMCKAESKCRAKAEEYK